MTRRRIVNSAIPLLGFVLVVALPSGCSEKPKVEENKAADHLRKIINAFDVALYDNKHPLRDETELKAALKKISPAENPDEIIRSPNDGEPYEIVWGVNLDRQTESNAIVAHEKKGAGGKRYVITVARIVSQMNDSDFANASFAKGKK